MKHFAVLFIVLLMTGASYGQVQNGGFEEWTDGNPDGWLTYNIPGFLTLVERSNSHYEGNFSARMLTTPQVPGSILMQNLGAMRAEDQVAVSFYYSALSAGGLGGIAVVGYVEDQAVDGTEGSLEPMGNAWMQYSNHWSPQVHEFDSLVVTIILSDTSAQPSAKSVLLDNFATSGLTPLSVESSDEILPLSHSLVSIYPNPFNGNATIRFDTNSRNARLSLIDPMGRLVGVLPVASSGQVSWNQIAGSSLPAGRYQIMLNADGKSSALPAVYLK